MLEHEKNTELKKVQIKKRFFFVTISCSNQGKFFLKIPQENRKERKRGFVNLNTYTKYDKTPQFKKRDQGSK